MKAPPVDRTDQGRTVVTNDDGIDSPGLHLLASVAARAGHDVLIAAPDHEASGSSAAMTAAVADGRVVIERRRLTGLAGTPAYAVRALPGFIAFTAARGGFGRRPSLLLSGINRGPNTGRAVLHSGTVGAALTAATSGLRAAAFSLDVRDDSDEPQWDTAAAVAGELLPSLADLPAGVALNVNVPNLPPCQLAGIRRGRLAEYGSVQVQILEATEQYLRITMSETAREPGGDCDSDLLASGYASVTPLRPLCEAADAVMPWPSADRVVT
jgi:5'-nucleotidase